MQGNLARLRFRLGNPTGAADLAEKAVRTLRELDEDALAAVHEMTVADLAARRGDLAAAAELYDSALSELRNGRDWENLTVGLAKFGALELKIGNPIRAGQLLGEALTNERRRVGRTVVEDCGSCITSDSSPRRGRTGRRRSGSSTPPPPSPSGRPPPGRPRSRPVPTTASPDSAAAPAT